jgi:MFS family permease
MGKSSGAGSPLATGAMFFGAGFGIASTFSRMPGIRDQLGVSPDQLAFALVFLGIGSLLGLPFAGRFVERYSSRTVSLGRNRRLSWRLRSTSLESLPVWIWRDVVDRGCRRRRR